MLKIQRFEFVPFLRQGVENICCKEVDKMKQSKNYRGGGGLGGSNNFMTPLRFRKADLRGGRF